MQDWRSVVYPWKNKHELARDLCDAIDPDPVTPTYNHIYLLLFGPACPSAAAGA